MTGLITGSIIVSFCWIGLVIVAGVFILMLYQDLGKLGRTDKGDIKGPDKKRSERMIPLDDEVDELEQEYNQNME